MFLGIMQYRNQLHVDSKDKDSNSDSDSDSVVQYS